MRIGSLASRIGGAAAVPGRGSLAFGWLLVAVGVALPFLTNNYAILQFTLVCVWAVGVLGVNLVTGFAGQISVAHAGFMAVGGYVTAILTADHGWSHLPTFVLGAVVCFGLGFLLGIPTLRLRGLYLALVTLAFGLIVPPLIRRFDTFTGGGNGKLVPSPEPPAWLRVDDVQWSYLVAFGVAVVVFVAIRNLLRGRVGRAVIAIRDNELVAEAFGVNPFIYKTLTFASSAALAGVAGGLYAMTVGIVAPDQFGLFLAVNLLAASVIGGSATIFGALFGALFIEFLPRYAGDISSAFPGVVYGVFLIACMLVAPGGIMGLTAQVKSLTRRIGTLRNQDV